MSDELAEGPMASPYAWLDTVKVGDVVVIEGNYESRMDTVARVTPTQVKIEATYAGNDEKYFRTFRRRDGREVGGYSYGYELKWLREATPARVAAVREFWHRRALLARIARARFDGLSTSALEAIVAALPAEVTP